MSRERPIDPQKLAETSVRTMYEGDAFSRWLGIEVLAVRPHYAKLRMNVRKDMLNGFEVCHGGVTFSFADSALAFASNTHGNITVSIENNIVYPARVLEDDVLIAVAQKIHVGNRIATYNVTVAKESGEGVAHFRGTVYRTNRPIPLPEKPENGSG